jgi:sporulation protein YlmC with PRC-barrel domain
MKYLGLTAASSVLVLMWGTADAQQQTRTSKMTHAEPAQECLDDLARLERQHEQAQLSESAREEVRQLTESARMLGERGRKDACETMVETISSISEEDRSRTMEQEGRQAHLDAPRVSDYEGIFKVSSINGATVRNLENEELGSIEDTVIDPRSGEISYVVLSIGGFLGVGEKLVAVPWDQLRIVESDDEDGPYYVVDATRETLERREGLDDDDWPRELKDRWE